MNILRQWTEFSDEWKRVRRDFSESSIHDFRVAARRLIAELELASGVSRDADAISVMRHLKKLLNRCSALRDLQVHLRRIERLGYGEILRRFSNRLNKREKDEALRLRHWMRNRREKALADDVRGVSQNLQNVLPGISKQALRSAIKASLQVRGEALVAAHRTYRDVPGPENFHKMRVQFKRFRYVVEAARSVLIRISKKQIDAMKELQSIMGEIHDIETFGLELVAWSNAQHLTNSTSIRSAIAESRKEHEARLNAFNKRRNVFETVFSNGVYTSPAPGKPSPAHANMRRSAARGSSRSIEESK